MTSRTFTDDDQTRFAALSGDFNPLHVDPVRARRLMFGAPAVHGIHSLLWSLDVWASRFTQAFALTSIRATFAKPVRVGQTVEFSIRKENDHKARFQLTSNDETVARIDIEWADVTDIQSGSSSPRAFAAATPIERQAYEDGSGTLPLFLDPTLTASLLPDLSARMAHAQIAALLATTRLVGMECPGLHSVYSELDLDFIGAGETGPINWVVARFDDRFGLLTIRLSSAGVAGEVRAFVRPPPRKQESFAHIRSLVGTDEFAGQRALVVGGSRGLGEVTANLLAAGGAEVMITFHQGADDACAVADGITAGGGSAAASPFDARIADADKDGPLAAWLPTHLYYFATPFIATGREGGFSQALFETFCSYYVSGLVRTVNLFGKSLKGTFNPSSVFVENRPDGLLEYAAAKAAAEYVGLDLANRRGAGFRLDAPRLPKMGTDQTSSISGAAEPDPTPVMMAHLRAFVRPRQ